MIEFDPNATVLIPLRVDKNTPDEKLPLLECRVMSRRKMARYNAIIDRAKATPDIEQASRVCDEALMLAIVDWRNIFDEEGKPVKFSRENLDVFTDAQIYLVAITLPGALSYSEIDAKKSHSPPPAPGATSAPGATAKSADAPPAAASQP
jgi:hypothetical protein